MAVNPPLSAETLQQVINGTYEIGKLGDFAKGGYIPANGQMWLVGTNPYTVSTKIYSDGETKIVVSILSDGTIHVDPEAFELMMEKMGYAEAK